ncbi:ATP-binding cassette domain-containing protein [Microbacterium laevaniformans]|uniref:ATP-binding cassette domain-containing protein n=1 Tax=Microbacterium laevaniformans TaxID=36807 RepID=UPI00195934ED|nr:ATP-binding cassette domain-containing protein [Microbacterium laevaniformans]GLJ65048.1 ABC transporter ATP-binding protein [Microbacterium laevaniformans]
MARDDAPVLELTGVTKRFRAVEALVDADLVVHRREVVALVGDNAAGKSTLARIVSGVYVPDEGTIRLDGVVTELASPSSAFRHGVAAVFQELALAENLDVVANIFLGHEVIRGGLMDNDRMDHLARIYLDQLGGGIPLLHAPVSELSAGQRQCVAIARTLVGSPRLVVLDEPTASLSIAQTAQVLSYIEHLRELGVGVILISHSISDVRAVADRIEVLRHGRNNGAFDARTTRYEDVIAAITGASQWRPAQGGSRA